VICKCEYVDGDAFEHREFVRRTLKKNPRDSSIHIRPNQVNCEREEIHNREGHSINSSRLLSVDVI
jgi:hypothetical protein